MEEMTFWEIIIYAILTLMNCVIAINLAKNGVFEFSINPKARSSAMSAAFIGMMVFLGAGYAEREGYVTLSLIREEVLPKTLMIYFSAPLGLFLFTRGLMPKGLLSYNKARARTMYWAIKYFNPGKKIAEGDILASFPMAQQAISMFESSITIQSKPVREMQITKVVEPNYEMISYSGATKTNCPSCGFYMISIPPSRRGYGVCTMCGANLAFKVINDKIYLTAFGPDVKAIRPLSPRQKANIAIVYEEKAFLLRMMNRFEDASRALDEAETIINSLLADDKNNLDYLKTKSLILFRKGEIAQASDDKTMAKVFYEESLEIDGITGSEEDSALMKRLVEEVS